MVALLYYYHVPSVHQCLNSKQQFSTEKANIAKETRHKNHHLQGLYQHRGDWKRSEVQLTSVQALQFSNLHRGAVWASSDVGPLVDSDSSIEEAYLLLFPVDSPSTVCQFPGSGSTWPLGAEFIITSG